MKTTVELPDELVIAAKKRAAELRRPLRVLIEDGLRAELRRRTPARRRTVKLRWVTVDGGLPEGLDLTDRTAMITWLGKNRRSRSTPTSWCTRIVPPCPSTLERKKRSRRRATHRAAAA